MAEKDQPVLIRLKRLGYSKEDAYRWINEWNKARYYLLNGRKECRDGKEEERA